MTGRNRLAPVGPPEPRLPTRKAELKLLNLGYRRVPEKPKEPTPWKA